MRQVLGLTLPRIPRNCSLTSHKEQKQSKISHFCKPQPWVNHVPTPLPEICWRKTLWTICGACRQWQFKSHEMWLASIELALSIPLLSYLWICRGWHLTQDQSIWLLLVLCTTVLYQELEKELSLVRCPTSHTIFILISEYNTESLISPSFHYLISCI